MKLPRDFEDMIENLKETTYIESQLSIQQNLRKALDESSMVSIIDKNGKITYVNDKFCKVSKYSKEELIGQRQEILRATKIHAPSFYADLWSVISKGGIWHGEISNLTKDGTLFWNKVTVVPFLDKKGNISEYVSIRNDITEQKTLADKMHNFKLAFDESALINIVDTNKKITYVNDRFCKVSKYSKEELVGNSHDMLRSEIHSPEFFNELWDVINSGKIWHGKVCNKAKDGTLFWSQTTIIPFKDQTGKIYEYFGVRIDITEQVKLSKELAKSEKMSVIGELSSRMAHDIKNPLAVLQNNISIMEGKIMPSDESFKETVKRTHRAIARIEHQINDVLNFVKNKELVKTHIRLDSLLESVISEVALPVGITINISLEKITFDCDSIQMESVFYNIIHNAIQSIGESGALNILLYSDDKDIVIEFSDDGPGIPVNKLEEVFEPLYTTKQTGTGLGLTSSKSIIELHGGEISAKNNLEKGTTFTIKLFKK